MNRLSIILALAATLCLAPGIRAQQTGSHQDAEQELHTLVGGRHAQGAAADRATVRRFLSRSDVGRVAAERGIDLDRLEEGVQALSPEEAGELANRVHDAQGQLAGGDTFVITSTTVIIALLIIILIIVA
jgi:hypothetical protein